MLFSDLTYDTYNKNLMESFKCVFDPVLTTKIHYMKFTIQIMKNMLFLWPHWDDFRQ